jgi:putative copper resistance protein D
VLLRLLHSSPARLLAHPVVAWVLFGGTLVALYAGPLLEWSLANDAVHVAVHLHFLLAGALFCWTAIGVDPSPHRLPDGARVGFVFLAVPLHAVVGLMLLSTTSLLAGGAYAESPPVWLDDVLADQRTGAGILWGAGELFGLVLTGIALARWIGADERAARRADAQSVPVHRGAREDPSGGGDAAREPGPTSRRRPTRRSRRSGGRRCREVDGRRRPGGHGPVRRRVLPSPGFG